MKKAIRIISIMLLSGCSVCHVTGGYDAATDNGKVCLECSKISKNLQEAISSSKTVKINKW